MKRIALILLLLVAGCEPEKRTRLQPGVEAGYFVHDVEVAMKIRGAKEISYVPGPTHSCDVCVTVSHERRPDADIVLTIEQARALIKNLQDGIEYNEQLPQE